MTRGGMVGPQGNMPAYCTSLSKVEKPLVDRVEAPVLWKSIGNLIRPKPIDKAISFSILYYHSLQGQDF